jgi:hypothetical protein
MLSFLYLGTTIVAIGIIWMLIRSIPSESGGLLIGIVVIILLSILLMIKIRCKTGPFPCGFMSFTGGFTWHIFIGLLISPFIWVMSALLLNGVKKKGITNWMRRIGYWSRPLLGLCLAAIWEVLPVSIIHPPDYGGPCPNIPVICHDLPLLGFGGLLYWSLPFVVWAIISTVDGIRSEFG